MPQRRSSQIQEALRAAADDFARREDLRGGPVYRLSQISGVNERSVRRALEQDSQHLVNIERLAEALGLEITFTHKTGNRPQ